MSAIVREAKCISVRLALSGEIVGSTKDLRVVVEVASATEGDSDTQVQQESSIKKSHFQIFAWFNTTSNVILAKTCDRLPHLVVVKLMEGRGSSRPTDTDSRAGLSSDKVR